MTTGRAALAAIGDENEEQLAAGPIEGNEAELVDDGDVDAERRSGSRGELARVAGPF